MPRNPVILMLLAALCASAADRDAADWVIRKHGRVMLNSARDPIASLVDLPKTPFQITGLDPFVNLESLDMSYSTFGDRSMASLAGMHNLRRLYLRDTTVTDEALKNIAGLTKLEELDLYGVRITDRGIAYLKDLKELRKL